MKLSLQRLAEMVEKAEPTVSCQILEAQNQIIVTFANRPEVEIALLTPYNQLQMKKGYMDDDDFTNLLFNLKALSN